MKKTAVWIIALVVVAAVVAVFFYSRSATDESSPVATAPLPPPVKKEPEASKPRYPIAPAVPPEQPATETTAEKPAENPPTEPVKKLPALDQSDAAVTETFDGLIGSNVLAKLFNVKNFIRRVVVTVDNLPRRQVPPRYLPTAPVGGQFAAQGEEGDQYLSQENFKRYAPYVTLLETVSAERLVDVYVYLYPLFQEAYDDLGYPNAYFNDRLVEAIDNLLATPEVDGPIRLVRPSVMFKYAEPELEALSAGQKIMLRMGPNNAARVKARLRTIRQLLLARVDTKKAQATLKATQ